MRQVTPRPRLMISPSFAETKLAGIDAVAMAADPVDELEYWKESRKLDKIRSEAKEKRVKCNPI